jgi:hypothetical protein
MHFVGVGKQKEQTVPLFLSFNHTILFQFRSTRELQKSNFYRLVHLSNLSAKDCFYDL